MVVRDPATKLDLNPETDGFIEKFDPKNHVLVFNTYDISLVGTKNYEVCAVSNNNSFESCTTFTFEVSNICP